MSLCIKKEEILNDKENPKLLRILKNFSFLIMILSFVFQTGTLLGLSRAFGIAEEKNPFEEEYPFDEIHFSQNKAAGVRVVFFERDGRSLFPKCQVPVEKYPEILPDFVNSLHTRGSKDGRSNHAATSLYEADFALNQTAISEFDHLENCDPNFSLELADRAEHFRLYPEVAIAFVPVLIVLANVGSCAIGGIMGFGGGSELATELHTNHRERRNANLEQRGLGALGFLPTRGEMFTGAAPVAGGALGVTTNNAYIRAHPDFHGRGRIRQKFGKFAVKTGVRAGGAVGFVCGVAGGLVGYFSGKSNIAHHEVAVANGKVKDLEASLLEAEKRSQTLEEELAATTSTVKRISDENQALQNALDGANIRIEVLESSLSETKRHLQVLQENLDSTSNRNQVLQNALDEANTRAGNLQSDLDNMREINSLIENVLGLRDEIDSVLANLETQSLEVARIVEQEGEKGDQVKTLDHELREKRIYVKSLRVELVAVKEQISNLELALETGFDDAKAVSLLELENSARELQQDVELTERRILNLEGNLTEEREELSHLTEQRKEYEEYAFEIHEIHVGSIEQRRKFEEFLQGARLRVQKIQQSLQETYQRISNLLQSHGDVESGESDMGVDNTITGK